MPRPHWRRLPVDPGEQQQYIEKILADSTSRSVKNLLTMYHRQYDLEIRSTNYEVDVDLNSVLAKLAAAMQTRATLLDDPCTSCAQGSGPFKGFRGMSQEENGRCANCIYLSQACSSGKSKNKSNRTLLLG